jgi:hypothetical protein
MNRLKGMKINDDLKAVRGQFIIKRLRIKVL